MRRHAFTMLELIFVIVVMGIIGKFGTEFLAQAYKSFIFAKVNHQLQSSSATSVEFIGSRLQHRIKDSVIVRTGDVLGFDALSSSDTTVDYRVLEWVASDVDGFRGTTRPDWSGIIDLDMSSVNILISPATETNTTNALISNLSYGNSGINDAALYFIGSNHDINGYGWDGNGLADQTSVMHPINLVAGNISQFAPARGDFTGVTVTEYYKLDWTAYAVVLENYNAGTNMGDLVFYYDYQPWSLAGANYLNGKRSLIMENVSTFRALAVGDIIKIQVCTKSNLVEEYSICKEKTIF